MKFAAVFAILVVALLNVVMSDEGKKRIRIQRYVKKGDLGISAAPSLPHNEAGNKKKIRIRQYVKRYDARKQSPLQIPASEITDYIDDGIKSQSDSNAANEELQEIYNVKDQKESLEVSKNIKDESQEVSKEESKDDDIADQEEGKDEKLADIKEAKTVNIETEKSESTKKDENSMSALTVDTSTISKIQTDGRKRIRVSKYYKKNSATQQLSVESPTSDDTLTANTTSTVYATADLSKAFKKTEGVIVLFVFTCTGGSFTVEALLGVPTLYEVNSDVNGECQVVAKVPGNPDFLESPPVFPKILIPIYFEGTRSTDLFTGEKISIFLRPSNNAILDIIFLIKCENFQKTIPIVTTVRSFDFNLPPLLLGQCEFSQETELPGYVSFPKIIVNISPAIFFLRPAPNTVIKPDENILVNLIATNLITDLLVTVELTCNDDLAATLTQDIRSTFTFVSSTNIYGQCVLSIADVDGYFTEQTIPIVVLKALAFSEPEAFALIQPNSSYNIKVTSDVPDGSVDVTVVGLCQSGGSFTITLPIGQSQTFIMGSQFLGFCTLTASATDFVDALTQIKVFTPLTPDQIKAAALALKIEGEIIDKTDRYVE